MAGHAESAEKQGGKHGAWLEKMRKIIRPLVGIAGFYFLGLGVANALVTTSCIAFPSYVLPAAMGASWGMKGGEKTGGHDKSRH